MISTNASFEADVAGGKIHPQSLQGQFTAKYFTGDQNSLIEKLKNGLKDVPGPPYSLGTTVPVSTHGKTFYFVAMSHLNEEGTAFSTPEGVDQAMRGLWGYVRTAGELQELVVPIIGTARGRLKIPRQKMIDEFQSRSWRLRSLANSPIGLLPWFIQMTRRSSK